ncbi:MAG: glucokinase [Candidatus Acidiferrales bacterium]
MILAGDVGGTKTNLGMFEERDGKLVCVKEDSLPSQKYATLEALVADFLKEAKVKVDAACFGIAGPIVDNRVRTTNIPWIVEGDVLARELGVAHVRLLNDLEATCYSVLVLEPAEFDCIHEGTDGRQATKVVIAAGTGLGEGVLFWDGGRYHPSATEGGHSDWAPNTEQQLELWRYLRERNEIVSCETILSGRGFPALHLFLDPTVRHPEFEQPDFDPAPFITKHALAGTCPVCVRTLDLWVDIYGSEAGNLAIRNVARGGIYVAGGIALKILPKLKEGRFAAAAAHKEKMTALLSQIPICIMLNQKAPLIGAAHVAAGKV